MSRRWSRVRLGEVVCRSAVVAEIDPSQEYDEITVKLWGKGVVRRGTVAGLTLVGNRRFRAAAGQFVISRIDARNGAFGTVPAELDGAVVSNDFPLFDLDRSRVEPGFLEWLSRTDEFVELCQRASEGTTNRVRLKEDRFLDMEIPLPPLEEQRRIVGQIERVAAKVTEAQELRRGAAKEGAALRNGIAEVVYRRLGSRFGCRSLAELCRSITDGDHNTPTFTDKGVKFIFVGNVSSSQLHFKGSKRVSQAYYDGLRPARRPERGDLLYSAVGATLGIPAIVDTDETFCFQRHVAILKPDRRLVSSRFLWYMLLSRTVSERAWELTTGSAQPTLPLRGIRQLSVPLPPLDMQEQATTTLAVLFDQVARLQEIHSNTVAELDALLPSILDRAFNGEL